MLAPLTVSLMATVTEPAKFSAAGVKVGAGTGLTVTVTVAVACPPAPLTVSV